MARTTPRSRDTGPVVEALDQRTLLASDLRIDSLTLVETRDRVLIYDVLRPQVTVSNLGGDQAEVMLRFRLTKDAIWGNEDDLVLRDPWGGQSFSLPEPRHGTVSSHTQDALMQVPYPKAHLDIITSGLYRLAVRATDGPGDQNVAPQRFAFTDPVIRLRVPPQEPVNRQPRIEVIGRQGRPITDDDMTPSRADGTDLGTIRGDEPAASRVFTIRNTGRAPLFFQRIDSTNSTDFSLTTGVPVSYLLPGGSAQITVTFDPRVTGMRESTIRIVSNAAGGSARRFTFAINGIADSAPQAVLRRIHPAGVAESTATFRIRNTGDRTLEVRSLRLEDYNGGSGQAVLRAPERLIRPGRASTFTISLGFADVALYVYTNAGTGEINRVVSRHA